MRRIGLTAETLIVVFSTALKQPQPLGGHGKNRECGPTPAGVSLPGHVSPTPTLPFRQG